MEAVARRGLRDLDHQQVGKEVQLSPQRRALVKDAVKLRYLHPYAYGLEILTGQGSSCCMR
jgi:hypothetical protein